MMHEKVRLKWMECLRDFDAETESFASFCRTHNLNYSNALSWKKRLKIGVKQESLEFSEVQISEEHSDFVLRCNGWEILVPSNFNDNTLRRILSIVGGA